MGERESTQGNLSQNSSWDFQIGKNEGDAVENDGCLEEIYESLL
jgi:hypothetical protein